MKGKGMKKRLHRVHTRAQHRGRTNNHGRTTLQLIMNPRRRKKKISYTDSRMKTKPIATKKFVPSFVSRREFPHTTM